MATRFRTREFLLISLLSVVVATLMTCVHVLHRARTYVVEQRGLAQATAQEVLAVATEVLAEPSSPDPAEALRDSRTLSALLRTYIVNTSSIVYVFVRGPDEKPIVSAPEASQLETDRATRPLEELERAGAFERLWTIFRPGRLFEFQLPIDIESRPFGAIHVGLDTSLVRADLGLAIRGSIGAAFAGLVLSWFVAFLVVRMVRRPLRRLSREIDRLRRGEITSSDSERASLASSGDSDFGPLAEKLRSLGRELQSERLELLGRKSTFSQAMDLLADAIVLIGPEDEILFCNRAFGEITGVPPAETVHRELDEILPFEHPLAALVERARSGADVAGTRILLPTIPPSGRFEESLVSISNVADSDRPNNPALSTLLVVIEDVGALRTLEHLLDWGAQLEEVGRVTSGIVHEVKNPLQAMHLHLRVVEAELGGPEGASERARASLKAISREIFNLDHVVRSFLDFVRGHRFEIREVELSHIFDSVRTLLAPAATERQVTLVFDVAENARSVLGDAKLLERVFVNLIQNAFDAMPSGGEVRVKSVCDGDECRISVTDSGAGIPEEIREKIFQLYFTTKEGGTGIGLPTVFRIIQQHRGRVEVESAEGTGSTFHVWIPRASVPLTGESEKKLEHAEP